MKKLFIVFLIGSVNWCLIGMELPNKSSTSKQNVLPDVLQRKRDSSLKLLAAKRKQSNRIPTKVGTQRKRSSSVQPTLLPVSHGIDITVKQDVALSVANSASRFWKAVGILGSLGFLGIIIYYKWIKPQRELAKQHEHYAGEASQ
jgi:hypothetical protein